MTQSSVSSTTQRALRVDEDVCAGHGRCFAIEAELFDSDDAGYPIVRHPTVPAELVAKAENAVANCPEGAIVLGLTN